MMTFKALSSAEHDHDWVRDEGERLSLWRMSSWLNQASYNFLSSQLAAATEFVKHEEGWVRDEWVREWIRPRTISWVRRSRPLTPCRRLLRYICRVMSLINQSCHVWMRHVTYEWVTTHMNEWVISRTNESCHKWTIHVMYEWVMTLCHSYFVSYIWMSHDTVSLICRRVHMNDSPHSVISNSDMSHGIVSRSYVRVLQCVAGLVHMYESTRCHDSFIWW